MATSKKEIVQQMNDAFSRNDMETVFGFCADDIHWAMVGQPPMVGLTAVKEAMKSDEFSSPPEIKVHHIIADENAVACNGFFSMTKKSGEVFSAAFCDVYHFNGDKIQELTSYIVELKEVKQETISPS